MGKLLLPLLLLALPVVAQTVYSYKDSEGNTVFTGQQPPANVQAQQVSLPGNTQNTAPDLNPINTQLNADTDTSNQQPVINKVTIQGIPDDGSLRANDGTFTVSILVETNTAALPSNYQYLLLLDGNPYGPPQMNNSFTLEDIDRGTHTIQGQIIFGNSVIASSDVKSFTLQRISVNSPRGWPHVKPQPR